MLEYKWRVEQGAQMAEPVTYNRNIRIPNLPLGDLVNQDLSPTDDELTFRRTLITSLQDLFGDEGVVIPQQPTSNITTIQNHTEQNNPSDTPVYTCQPGTFIYDSTTNEVKVSVLVAGVPTFKVVTVT